MSITLPGIYLSHLRTHDLKMSRDLDLNLRDKHGHPSSAKIRYASFDR